MRIVFLLLTAFLISCGNKEQKKDLSVVIKLSIKNFEKVSVDLGDRFPDVKVLQSRIRIEPDSAILILERKIAQPGFLDMGIVNPAYKANWPIILYADGSGDTIFIEADMKTYARKTLKPYPGITTNSALQNELTLYRNLQDSMRSEYFRQKDSVKNLLIAAIEKGNQIDTLSAVVNDFDKHFKFFQVAAAKNFQKRINPSVISVYAALDASIARWEPGYGFELYKNLPEDVRNSLYGEMLNDELIKYSAVNEAVGDTLHVLYGETENGRKIAPQDIFKGSKYTLVVFWASWCGSCVKEVPELNELYAKYKKKGFSLIAVSIDKDRQKWLNAVEENNYKGLHLLEKGGELNIKEYNIFALPYSFLVDQGGIIANVNSPLDSIRMKLEKI
ncbi:TlpA family protein disulfide reductase [Chitinophaga niabensis]|uniref:Thiol-disulfide isomerase or thioredoxin n=1 Tax=Chitinophaga niabensis TaxID=536979 RepID=A0A1N6J457_9BACT|nr:TlpA disulfide reductase family protein [Chitinophaga niabensis]SIO39042.1 Thiol-disulfide isomerase or thioredoxin [Chitinophaga niabensis]